MSIPLAVVLTIPGESHGQTGHRCWLEGRGGLAIPTGELTEFADPGFGVGVGVGCPVTARLGLTGTLVVDVFGNPADLPPGTSGGTKVSSGSLLAGVSLSLTNRWSAPATPSVVARAAFGATGVGVSRTSVVVPGAVTRIELLEGTSFTTETGLRVGLPISGRFLAFVDGAWRLVFVDEEDVDRPFGRVAGFGKVSIFSVTASLEFRL